MTWPSRAEIAENWDGPDFPDEVEPAQAVCEVCGGIFWREDMPADYCCSKCWIPEEA